MSRSIRFFAVRAVAAGAVLGSASLIAPASTEAQFTSQHQALLNHSATPAIIGGNAGTTAIPFSDLEFRNQVDGDRALLGRVDVVETPVRQPSQIDNRPEDLPVDGTWALLGRRVELSISDE
jgi:hypothetical protein